MADKLGAVTPEDVRVRGQIRSQRPVRGAGRRVFADAEFRPHHPRPDVRLGRVAREDEDRPVVAAQQPGKLGKRNLRPRERVKRPDRHQQKRVPGAAELDGQVGLELPFL